MKKNETEKKEPIAKPKCGSPKKKNRGLCVNRAGMRTDHEGVGKCYLHGGRTQKIDFSKGRYSQLTHKRIGSLIEQFQSDPDPLNLLEEIALLRALTVDLVERWESIYGVDGAVIAWHESFHTGEHAPKPRQLPDYSLISGIVEKTGAMVDRIVKQKQEGSITMQTLTRVLEQFGVEVARAIGEEKLESNVESRLLRNIEQRWKSIRA